MSKILLLVDFAPLRFGRPPSNVSTMKRHANYKMLQEWSNVFTYDVELAFVNTGTQLTRSKLVIHSFIQHNKEKPAK